MHPSRLRVSPSVNRGFNAVTVKFFRPNDQEIFAARQVPPQPTNFDLDLRSAFQPTDVVQRVELTFTGPTGAGGGIAEVEVFSVRPGEVDPIGFRPDKPVYRDDELVLFGGESGQPTSAFMLDMRATTPGLKQRLIPDQPNLSGGVESSGSIFGTPAEQIVDVRTNPDGTSPRLEIWDTIDDGTIKVRGTYSIRSPLPADFPIVTAVYDFDGLVTNGVKHDEIVVAYETAVFGTRRFKVEILSFRNVTEFVEGQPAQPLVLASVVLNYNFPGNLNLGTGPNQAGFNGLKLAVGRFGVNGEPGVAFVHAFRENATTRRLLISAHTFASLASGLSVPINNTQTGFAQLNESEGFGSIWDVAAVNFNVETNQFPTRDELVLVSRGVGAQFGEEWRSIRILTYTWGANTLLQDTNYLSRLIESRTPLVSLSTNAVFRVLPFNEVNASGVPTGNQDIAVWTYLNQGAVVQAYELFPGFGEPGVRAYNSSRLAWPDPAGLAARPVGTISALSPIFAVGNAVLRRSDINLPGSQVPSIYTGWFSTESGGDVSNIVRVSVNSNTRSFGTPTFIPVRNRNNFSVPLGFATRLLLADVDGDSGYYQRGSLFLGPGRRLAFDNLNAPTVLLQEPPKHVDYLRAGTYAGASRQVVNVSKRPDFYVEYVNESGQTVSNELKNTVSSTIGESFGASVTANFGVEAAIGVSTSVSTTVRGALDQEATSARTRMSFQQNSTTLTDTYRTADDDSLVIPNRAVDIWRYPVLGVTAEIGSTPPVDPFFQLAVPGPIGGDSTQSGATAPDYQPRHTVSNILSYPAYTSTANPGDEIRPTILGDLTPIYNNNDPGRANPFGNPILADGEFGASLTGSRTLTIASSGVSTTQFEQEQKMAASLDVNVTAKVEASGGPAGIVTFSGGIETSFDYGIRSSNTFNNMSTRIVSSSRNNRIAINRPGLLTLPITNSTANYFYFPAFYFDATGATKVAHYVRLDPNVSFWTQQYGLPDAAINLPNRIGCTGSNCNLQSGTDRAQMKSFAVLDDNDTALPGRAVAGERLRIQARVWNLTANAQAAAAINAGDLRVQFDIEEIDLNSREVVGPRFSLGQTIVNPPNSAPYFGRLNARQNLLTNANDIVWDTTNFGACSGTSSRYYRVLVTLDPDNTIAETHELFDRDASPLLGPDALPIDAAFAGNRVGFLEKGQNNQGWFIVEIEPGIPGPGCQPTPAASDVFLAADSLAVSRNGSSYQFANAQAEIGDSLQLRVRARSNAPAFGPRYVVVFNGTPLPNNSNAIGFGVVPNVNGTADAFIFDRNTGQPWMPSAAGTFNLVARVQESLFDTTPGDNTDSITLTVVPMLPDIFYVNAAATGSNTGENWTNAFTNLDAALALIDGSMPSEILVAQGTYVPSMELPGNPGVLGFNLFSGLTIKGGYRGSGPNADDRNFESFRTVLSADLQGNDGPNFSNRGDNSRVLFQASQLAMPVMLDGLTMRGCEFAAIQSVNTNLTLTNVTLHDSRTNLALVSLNGGSLTMRDSIVGAGGAGLIGNNGLFLQTFDTSPLRIERCSFINNSHGVSGLPAVFRLRGVTSADILACRFIGNTTTDTPAVCSNASGSPVTRFVNCLFARNQASGLNAGGSVLANGAGTMSLINCTLTGSSSIVAPIRAFVPTTFITNSIVYQNAAATAILGAATVTYSDIQGGFAGTGNINTDPRFVNPGSGDYRLQAASPCINAGSTIALPAGTTTDLAGRARVTGAAVDMGAYEASGCPADVDDGSGTGTPDGGVTIEDLLYYLNIYTEGNVRADLDDGSGTGTPDGGVTIDDLLYFLVRYEAGC